MFADRAESQEHLDVGGLIGRPGGFCSPVWPLPNAARPPAREGGVDLGGHLPFPSAPSSLEA